MIRFLRRLASADAIGLLLIVAAVQAFTFGISSSLRNTDTRYFFWVCLLAVFIALQLNQLRLSGRQASICMIIIGVLGIWIVAAQLFLPLLDLGKVGSRLLPQLIPSIRSHYPIDGTALIGPWHVVMEASTALGLRIQGWLMSLGKPEAINDGLVRSMIWTLIVWLIAAWMGWFTGRRNAVTALLPSILLLALVTSYSEHRVYTLWGMVSILLLMMGIWNYRNHTAQWERKKVDYSDSIRYDVTQAVIFLTLAIGGVAFITPSVSWQDIRDFLRERNQPAQKNEAADILGIRPAPVVTKKVPSQKPALPRDHLLTEGFAQSEKVVMTIRTGELPPIPGSILTDHPPRYYWRSVTYDTYFNVGWVTSAAPPQRFEANTPLIPGLLKGYKALHLDVKMIEPEGKLFWSGVLFSADVPFTVDWRLRPQSNLFADPSELLQSDMFMALSNAKAYRTESYVPLVSEKQLREASTEYPEFIQQHYLPLPEVPPRVRQLAEAITMGKTNPYDKAKAIETYLRETYPYDLNIPAPPEDRDVADYFLFELRRGYCDYYATAMVVLARASGVPARFVSGYSSGEYDAPNAQYVVRELNAHSWAEVYFPRIGWVEFEPTASEPEIERATVAEEQAASTDENADPIARNLLNRFRIEQAIYLLLPIALICLLLMLYFVFIERWVYLRLAPTLAIEKIYRNLYRRGRPLAGARTVAETAYEFKQKLIGKIEMVRKGILVSKLLFSAQNDIEYLTELYQSTLFRQSNMQKQDTKKALQTWKRLRLRLWIARAHLYLVNEILGGLKNFYQHVRRSVHRSKVSNRAGV